MPTDGYLTSFSQTLPIFADKPFIGNTFLSSNYHSFNENLVGAAKFYLDTIHGLNDEDVRVTDRITLPRNNLKGFQAGRVGPVDNTDYVGGNYAASLNFDTTLPMILPSAETIDFKYFVDIGNVWGIDYSDSIDDSNTIRSSTGITVDWFTAIGPLNFSYSQDLSKASTDKTESFQFNLGTTF